MKFRFRKRSPLMITLASAILALALLIAGLSARAQTALAPATSAPATKAATASAPAEEDDKTKYEAYVGVYINQFKSVDIKTNTFVVDFWIWFRWKGDGFKPLESFEVIGGTIDSKEHDTQRVIKGMNYAQARVTATVTKFFDLKHFPLDSHTLALEIEDSDREQERLVYIPDTENSGMADGLQVAGWRIDAARTKVVDFTYSTNYGDISLETGSKSIFSRFSYQVDLVRPGIGYYFKLFWSLFLATIIALLALLIDPIDLDPRFGLGVGAIFAAIASAYVISSSLPESNQYTMADKLNMLAVAVIFASILQSVFSLRLWKSGKEAASKSLDSLCFWGFLAVYAVGCVVISIM